MALRSIELFAGAGGGCLASAHLLGHDIACYVERDPYAAAVLEARIRDGMLPDAPIWDDVRTFDGIPWRGRTDILAGGFPCQFASSAARGRNVAPNLWPEMLRIAQECQPRFVFAENVTREAIEAAGRDLVGLGYSVRFTCLSSAAMGAPHLRTRWWLVGDANGNRQSTQPQHVKVAGLRSYGAMDWWTDDSAWRDGVSDGVANRVDRLRATGNGQVPLVAAAAWHILRQGE